MFLSSQDFAPPSRRRAEAAHAREGITRHRDEIREKVRARATLARPTPDAYTLEPATDQP